MLDVFKQNKLNLTWIESFPAKTGKQEYMFFVDFEGHLEEPKVKRALNARGNALRADWWCWGRFRWLILWAKWVISPNRSIGYVLL